VDLSGARRLRKYTVLIDDKAYEVELTTHVSGAPFSVKVNDKSYEAELMNLFEGASPFSIKVGGKKYDVELKRIEKARSFPIKVNSFDFKAELRPAARKAGRKAPESAGFAPVVKPARKAVVEGAVTAPMAGKIVSVLVKEGDPVKTGDALCVLEAMKMENEITATNTGVVQEIRVSEGMPVNEGDALIIIK
jgi:biotin carboxyl carrier protein